MKINEYVKEERERIIDILRKNKEIDDQIYNIASNNSKELISEIWKDLIELFEEESCYKELLNVNLYYSYNIFSLPGTINTRDNFINLYYESGLTNDVCRYNKFHSNSSIAYAGAATDEVGNSCKLKPIILDIIIEYFKNLGFDLETQLYINEFEKVEVRNATISINKQELGKLILDKNLEIIENINNMFIDAKKTKEEIQELNDLNIENEIKTQSCLAGKLLIKNILKEYVEALKKNYTSVNGYFTLDALEESEVKTNEITLHDKAVIYNKYHFDRQIYQFECNNEKYLIFKEELFNLLESYNIYTIEYLMGRYEIKIDIEELERIIENFDSKVLRLEK